MLLAALFASLALVLALYRGLKETSAEYALGGLLLYLLSLGLLVLGSTWAFFVYSRLADLYQVAAVQTTVVDMYRVTCATVDTFGFTGGRFFFLSALALGAVMLGNRDYGRNYGGVSLVIGLVGIVLLVLLPAPPFGSVVVLLLVFLLVFGWKTYALSRTA